MSDLKLRASEVLARLGRHQGLRPLLLAGHPEAALVRTLEGLRELPWDRLPETIDLAPLVDHTLLRADANRTEIDTLCAEALEHGFASVCVNPCWVPSAVRTLQGSSVRVCTVVGFPLGASTSGAKAFEAQAALQAGALEVDMVLALGAVKSEDWAYVSADLQAVRQAVPQPAILKVILEACLLTEAEIQKACALAVEAGLDFVKTSTGFSTGGATEQAVALMRATVGDSIGVKASGGIRTRAQALAMVRAGATRLGLSASVAVVRGDESHGSGAY